MDETQLFPIRLDLEIYRGDSWTRMFRVIGIDPSSGATADINMTGWTGRMQIREHLDGPVLFEANTPAGRIICGPQSGGGFTWNLLVGLIPADTASLPAGMVGVYDIELTDVAGRPETFYAGRLCVEGDVTR